MPKKIQIISCTCMVQVSDEEKNVLAAMDYTAEVAPVLENAGAIINSVEYTRGRTAVTFNVYKREDARAIVKALDNLLSKRMGLQALSGQVSRYPMKNYD